jgi:hypothetical protein
MRHRPQRKRKYRLSEPINGVANILVIEPFHPAGGFAKIHPESTFVVLSRRFRTIMARFRPIGSGFWEPSVSYPPLMPSTQDRAIETFELSQPISRHFSPANSLTRGPKKRETRPIVRNGAVNPVYRRLNSLIVKILPTFVGFEGRFPWGLREDLSNGDGGDLAVLDARYDEAQKFTFQTERHGALGM